MVTVWVHATKFIDSLRVFSPRLILVVSVG